MIKDFVPLAGLDDLVFGGWDIFEDNGYEAAKTAGVLDERLLEQIEPEMEAHQAHEGGLRPLLRQAARRPERQDGQEQARARRAGARRHPAVQAGATAATGW